MLAQHGHGDHGGGLINLVETLLAHGYAVYAPDLRGHGRSPGARGGLRGWSQYRQDLHAIRTRVAAQHPELPLFLLGHSLGGVVVLEYALHHGPGLADPITPPAKARDFFAAVGTADKEWREYAELRHRPFDDLGREQVVADLTAWLARHS